MPTKVDPRRSRNMAAIRGRDTKPELTVRQELHRLGFRFRLHDSSLPGKPDLKLTCHKAVVFVHGCFWHRHKGCRFMTTPATNTRFWAAKLKRNAERDSEHIQQQSAMGWRAAIVWECALRPRNRMRADPMETLAAWLRSDRPKIIIPRVPPEKAGS